METLSRSAHIPSLDLSTSGRYSPIIFSPNSESEQWVREWESVQAKELIDGPLVVVDADTSVEEACDVLLSNKTTCIAINDPTGTSTESPFLGLFDFADVNAFLTLAALLHTKTPDELRENSRAKDIIKAAKTGKIPVRLVSNLSEKNPLEVLSDVATLVDLLRVFATGTHRILIRSASSSHSSSSSASSSDFLGFISDRSLLSYFDAHAKTSAPLSRFLNNPLHSLTLSSINLRTAVVSCTASARVLDAMELMSDEGVSSVAVVEDGSTTGTPGQTTLLSAVSVTDVGKIVVPAQSNQILQMPLQQFVAQIKEPDGSTDGEDRYPVYSVSARSTLRFTIEKILATNAHRVFVTEDLHSGGSSPVSSSSPTTSAPPSAACPNPATALGVQLRGVVSVIDVLGLFARLAGLPDVDPTRMQRHRRFSSASSQGSGSGRSPEVKPVGASIHAR